MAHMSTCKQETVRAELSIIVLKTSFLATIYLQLGYEGLLGAGLSGFLWSWATRVYLQLGK